MTDDTTAISADGTELSVHKVGSGTPLVLVHGTTGSKESWALTAPVLAERHTVWSYDRRGRGESGDAQEYSLEREVADVRAVVAAAGPRAHLVGHSFGALCCLEAAAKEPGLRSLVLYEPPVHAERCHDAIERAAARFEAGDVEGGLEIFMSEVAGITTDERELLRSMPDIWSRLLDGARTAARECNSASERSWDPARYRTVGVPTLLLVGSLTDAPVYLSHEDLLAAVPHAEVEVLEGQRHLAFAWDPQGFADAVLAFTTRHDGAG